MKILKTYVGYSQNVFLLAQPKWRDDERCGENFLAPDGLEAQCNPNGTLPCCNTVYGWCGVTNDHCICRNCIDYRPGILILF